MHKPVKIKVLPHEQACPNGKEFVLEQKENNLCQELLNHGVNIEHACDMKAACTTCHIIVREGFSSLNQLEEQEEDLLDKAWGLTSLSRLACQVFVQEQDLLIEIPKYSINLARE